MNLTEYQIAAERIAVLEEQLRLAKLERRRGAQAPRDEPGGILYWTIGIAIRNARVASGMNQEELARRVELSRTSIVNIEGGRQRLPLATLYDIADALGLQATLLLPRNEDV
jgi:DNA-binding XRE family transcriptional regulator